jgi:hypothetical protein
MAGTCPPLLPKCDSIKQYSRCSNSSSHPSSTLSTPHLGVAVEQGVPRHSSAVQPDLAIVHPQQPLLGPVVAAAHACTRSVAQHTTPVHGFLDALSAAPAQPCPHPSRGVVAGSCCTHLPSHPPTHSGPPTWHGVACVVPQAYRKHVGPLPLAVHRQLRGPGEGRGRAAGRLRFSCSHSQWAQAAAPGDSAATYAACR